MKTRTTDITDLPTSATFEILRQLGPEYLGRLKQTHKNFCNQLNTPNECNSYWESQFKRDFPNQYNDIKQSEGTTVWHGHYRNAFEERKRRLFINRYTFYSSVNSNMRDLFHWVCTNDQQSIEARIDSLVQKNEINLAFDNIFWDSVDEGHNLISLAGQYGRMNILKYFYKLICEHVFHDQNVDRHGQTKLYFAAACGLIEEVKTLAQTENVNHADQSGIAPLHVAAQYGYLAVVSYLLEQGAKVDHANLYGHTALRATVSRRGRLDIVRYLLGHGANVDKADNQGTTPLHVAAGSGRLDIVRHLLENGANVNKVDSRRETPWTYAEEPNHTDVLREIKMWEKKLASRSSTESCVIRTPEPRA